MTEDTPKKRTVGEAVLQLMLDGSTNEETLEAIKKDFPDNKTSMSSITWYRNKFRQDGHDIPTARELRKAQAARENPGGEKPKRSKKKAADPLDA